MINDIKVNLLSDVVFILLLLLFFWIVWYWPALTKARKHFGIINRRNMRYPLPIAQKDYFLALALDLIYNSDLKDKLIFKGGTALHHCYLSQKRFSEDLDFTAMDKNITLDEIQSIIESNGAFKVIKEFQSKFTIKIERLRFERLLGQNGHIKFEIDRFQKVILPGKKIDYKNVWGVSTVPTGDGWKRNLR